MASTSGEVQAEPSSEKLKTNRVRENNQFTGDIDSGSGSENGEKPVREKLKKTDLDEIMQASTASNTEERVEILNDTDSEARAARKRSLEGKDALEEPSTPSGIHTRKRSRDTTSNEVKRQTRRSSLSGEVLEEEDERVDMNERDTPSNGVNTPMSSEDEARSSSTHARRPRKKRSHDDMDMFSESDRERKLAMTDESKARRSSSEGPSDPEEYEKFTAELKAKKGTIEGGNDTEGATVAALGPDSRNDSPQKLTKKRSRDVLDEDFEREQKKTSSARHSRLRSLSAERLKDLASEKHSEAAPTEASAEKTAVESTISPSKPRPEDLPQTSASTFAASGFASMAGSTSPFGALSQGSTESMSSAGPKDGASESLLSKPSSAFAGSGFASMTENKSPFGSSNINQSNLSSSFGSFGQGASAPVSTFGGGFASVSGAHSPFASGKVGGVGGFGSSTLGGGFGGGFGAPSKLSTFAAPVGDTNLGGTTSAKPFGAPEETEADAEDESGSDGGSDTADPERPNDSQSNDIEAQASPGNTTGQTEQNRKFKIKEVTETGEEGEYSAFQGRGRLYHFVNGQWTEKGSGVIKLNTVYDIPEEDERGEQVPIEVHVARLIMRAAATHKVILNARIFKEMKIGDGEGNEPKGKSLLFSVPVEGKLVPHTLKMGQDGATQQLYQSVKQLQTAM